MNSPMIPMGYVAFSDSLEVVAANARSTAPWGLEGNFDSSNLVDRVERRTNPEGNVDEFIYLAEPSAFIAELGQRLTAGILSAIGIDTETGNLVRLSASDWRRPLMTGSEVRAPVSAACAGAMLSIIRPDTSPVTALPIVSLHDLAVSFHASAPPAPPPSDLLDISSAATAEPQLERSAHAQVWMQGYARGFLDGKGDKPKREVAIAACKAAGCRHTDAENAWEALPSEFRRPARTPRDTPQGGAS